jgi:primosomal protein N' (replication factor Y)
VDALTLALALPGSSQFLLDGVTASGKTEVYLHAAAEALGLGRGVILLVPEIALTPQLVHRFRARLGDEIAVLHSALTEKARFSAWQQLRSGRLKVVIGARSALFAPVEDLGLICVDEEHDGSYKQEEGVRYNARDMALLRAHRASAVCVLGSATPSLASEAAVQGQRMNRLVLPGRAHLKSELPQVELIDLTRFGPGPSGDPLLSLPLHRALESTLASGDQAILFLNRRGFAPSLVCKTCGEIAQCPHCSVALTLHHQRGTRLECHYCDFQIRVPERCGACGGAEYVEEGTGTERIEALLRDNFPGARVARLHRDVASGKRGEAIIESVRRREVDILIGTQMVTKGHDLPGVTLVGVLNADAALSLPDFRAAERTFHLLVQVAGRAGRADKPGRVLIQTRSVGHPAIVCAQNHDVRGFIEHEMHSRREVEYPPFVHVALVRFDGVDETTVAHEARRVAGLLHAFEEVDLLGPAPVPLIRLRNRFRYRFLLRSKDRLLLRKALLAVARAPVHRHVRRAIDVDPQSMR